MTTLYRLFASDDQLLYVGIAGNPGRRFEQHAHDKPWWSEVSRVSLTHFPGRIEALEAERDAIRAERPQHNIVHNQSVVVANEVEWTCDVCGRLILNGNGWLELPQRDRHTWQAIHRGCSDSSGSLYLIELHRMLTRDELDEWDDHLRRKAWIDETDWTDVLERVRRP